MGQVINRLKQTDLKRTKPGMFADGAGLYLRVSIGKDGAICRSWIYRYSTDTYVTATRKDGTMYQRQREAQVGLGAVDRVGLEDARRAAKELDRKRHSGECRDPAKARKEQRAARRAKLDDERAIREAETKSRAMIFDKAVDAYVEKHRARWSAAHYEQVKDSLVRFVSPTVGHLPVDRVTVTHVIDILKPMWGTTPVTGSRVRARLQAVLDLGYSLIDPDNHEAAQALVDRNPARATSHLLNVLSVVGGAPNRTVKSFPAMDYREVGAFMIALRVNDTVIARALEFVILTASRSAQTIQATWSEIDFDSALWTIPGSRMKNGKEHIVHWRSTFYLQDGASIG
jgi:hypothetical protein